MNQKAIFLLLFLTVFLSMVTAQQISYPFSVSLAENSWVLEAPMRVARAYPGVADDNGKIYVIGGDTGDISVEGTVDNGPYYFSSVISNINEMYDIATDNWTFKASMPTCRAYFGVAVYQDKIYCIGGWNGSSPTGINEAYDTLNNSWSTKAPMPYLLLPGLVNSVDGRIYVMGTYPNGGLSRPEVYDIITDSWTTLNPPPYEIIGSTSTTLDKNIYFIASNDSAKTQFILLYNTENDTWIRKGAAPTGGIAAVAGATSGLFAPELIYFFANGATNVYNATSDAWFTGKPMASGVAFGFGITLVNDIFYVIGGQSGEHDLFIFLHPEAKNELYTPYGYGDITPKVSIIYPENKTYQGSIPLQFMVEKPVSLIEYSLDGKSNVSITGNSTLTNLSNGQHNLTVYAKYVFGDIGTSETVEFTTAYQPFPIVSAAAIGVTAVAVCLSIVYYSKKIKHTKMVKK